MKCLEYDPDAYGCMSPLVHGRCPNVSTIRCKNGWLTFWTPAERAGLKAMGSVLSGIKKSLFHSWLIQTKGFPSWQLWRIRNRRQGGKAAVYHAIRAYVQAARKIKETEGVQPT